MPIYRHRYIDICIYIYIHLHNYAYVYIGVHTVSLSRALMTSTMKFIISENVSAELIARSTASEGLAGGAANEVPREVLRRSCIRAPALAP